MRCSQKTLRHFLSVSNGPLSFLSDISNLNNPMEITRNQSFWGIFGKSQVLARDIFEMSQKRHGKNIFFEICFRRLKDVTQKTSLLRCF